MGLSVWHLIIVLVIVLLFFGPSRLGELGKSFGQAIRGFKKGLNEDSEIDVTDSVKREEIREGRGEAREESSTTKSTSTKTKA